jgi:glycosyltransferase involved in cell wall biosynthesis
VSADIVTVNSEDARREVTERGFSVKEVHVIPNGVDGNLFAPSPDWPTDGGYLLYVGRLVEQKGLEYLLRALDHVRAKFPSVRLKVAGTGEFEDWLKILCSSPSIFEPFGMVALEAFACKRPVIASRVGGLREIVQHGKSGFLAEPRDHLDLAQWIMALLFDADQRRRLGEAGFNQLSRGRYAWASIAREFIKVYGSIKADTSRPGRAAEFIQQIRSSAPRGQEEPWRKFFDDLFVQGQS